MKGFKPKLWKNDFEITELKFSQKTIKSNSNLEKKSADEDLEHQEDDYEEIAKKI